MTPPITSYELSKRLHDLGVRPKESLWWWIFEIDSVWRVVWHEHIPKEPLSAIKAFTTDELAELVKGLEWSLWPSKILKNWLVEYFDSRYHRIHADTPCEALGLYIEAMVKEGRVKV